MTGAAAADQLTESARRIAGTIRRPVLSQLSVGLLSAGLDLVTFALLFWFAAFAATPPSGFEALQAAINAGSAACLAASGIFVLGGYRLHILLRAPISALIATLTAFALGGGLTVLATDGVGAGRIWQCLAIATGCLVPAQRIVLYAALDWARDCGVIGRRAVVVGGGLHAERLIRGLAERAGNTIRIHAIFDDRRDERSPLHVLGVPRVGRFQDLVSFTRLAEIDMIIIALPLEAEKRIEELLEKFRVLPQQIHLSAFSSDFAFRDSRAGDGTLIPAIDGSFQPSRRLSKRMFDLVFASLALILVAPVLLLAALAVRLDSPGPILFRQTRLGFNNRPVDVLKFRTMYSDATDPAGRRVVTRNDPRVTRIGRILRKTSIDELPQLFNVLGGSLSLVGPRPHAVDARSSSMQAFDQIVEGYAARHRLPPGITGWAQVNGWRGEVDQPDKLRERVAHDLYYIENWSLWLDAKILFRTPFSLLNMKNAY